MYFKEPVDLIHYVLRQILVNKRPLSCFFGDFGLYFRHSASWRTPVALRRLAEVAQIFFMYTVYALYNKVHDKIYIGQTADIENRIVLHNTAVFRTSYTARFSGDWVVIYSEQASDRKAALKREKQLKSYRGREFVKRYIPRWRSGSAARC